MLLATGLITQPAAAQTLGYGKILGEGSGQRLDARLTYIPNQPKGLTYGPFRVVGATRALMNGITDSRSPGQFEAMMRDYPQITTLELALCPGTYDDQANLRLGRMIRAGGISTYVPNGGWVASGAVEIFLAGVHRYAEPTARFAVHSWEDYSGREPGDLPPDSPQNRAYLDYYRTMGMSDQQARAFYAMTNSVPFEQARFLSSDEMAQWVSYDPPQAPRGAIGDTIRNAIPAWAERSAAVHS